MGRYADNLLKRLQDRQKPPRKIDPNAERLVAAAIVRASVVYHRAKSHYELRMQINDDGNGDRREPGDVDGFWTSKDRFVSREEAKAVGVEAGQLHESWLNAGRELLSSDINWN